MATCERTPLHRHLSNMRYAVLLLCCLAASSVHAKPLDAANAQLPANEAMAPKRNEDASSISALSPGEEAARKLWNNFKQFRRTFQPKRYVRNVAQQQNVGNVTVPKFILELYQNLTHLRNSSRAEQLQQQTTQANTVRSLQMINNNDDTKCETFNFTISSINSSEFVVKAELRLHLHNIVKSTTRKNIFVAVKTVRPIGTEPWTDTRAFNVENIDLVHQEYVFDVTPALYELVTQNETQYAEFKVEIYESSVAYNANDQPLGCNEVRFVHSSSDEETEPLLIVQSYDFELEKIGYKTILENLNRTEVRRRRSAPASHSKGGNDRSVHRRARRNTSTTSTQDPPVCDIYALEIKAMEIPRMEGEEVLIPEAYNAGICGGDCGQSLPGVDLNHNHLVHMLQTTAAFRDRHGYEITRCCAPIAYAPLQVIVNPAPTSDSQVPFMKIIPNMRIVKCECIEVVNFPA